MPAFTAPDGVRLHYEIAGEGPALVLHLGAGGDSDLWRAAGYLEPLAETYTCILFDHRGHGKSDHPTSPAANHIDRYADDLTALVRHLGHTRVSFLGWSNAVAVALKAAHLYPKLFDSLVLFGPIAPRATAEQLAAGSKIRVAELRSRGWWFLLDDMTAAETLHPVPQWMLDRITATDIEPFIAWSEERPLWNWSPWDALPLVGAPTLMIVGALEDPEDVMGKAASLMPLATRVRIPDREHINAFVDCELVLPHVQEFLARHAGR